MKLPTAAQVERCLHDGYLGAPGTRLRKEDVTKCAELLPMLEEVARAVRSVAKSKPLVLVDAAAGKGYLGVLAAKLILDPLHRSGEVVLLERNPKLLAAAQWAGKALEVSTPLRSVCADVGDLSAWPQAPAVVVALHACGDATDRVLDAAVAKQAQHVLVVPCCVGKATRGVALAKSVATALRLPPSAPIQRRLVHAVVDGERLLRLEGQGYQAQAVEVMPSHVSPWNLLLRAKRVREPVRQARAASALESLKNFIRG